MTANDSVTAMKGHLAGATVNYMDAPVGALTYTSADLGQLRFTSAVNSSGD